MPGVVAARNCFVDRSNLLKLRMELLHLYIQTSMPEPHNQTVHPTARWLVSTWRPTVASAIPPENKISSGSTKRQQLMHPIARYLRTAQEMKKAHTNLQPLVPHNLQRRRSGQQKDLNTWDKTRPFCQEWPKSKQICWRMCSCNSAANKYTLIHQHQATPRATQSIQNCNGHMLHMSCVHKGTWLSLEPDQMHIGLQLLHD